MSVPTISYKETLVWENPIYVDVRAPVEFVKDHIPHAINYPLFNDVERAYIGTLYHTQGKEKALLEGVSIASLKLRDMLSFFSTLKEHQVIIYCYRGGMRSESVVSLCNSIGFSFYKLYGGYKEYRHYVRNYLTEYTFTIPVFTLYGFAGSGKTRVLQHIPHAIDLEHCAGNRSSLFGSVGMPNYSQKFFESRLTRKLQETSSWTYCLFEGESHRIGNCHIPHSVLYALQHGTALWMHTPLETRIQHIHEEYLPFINDEIVMSALDRLIPSMGKSKIAYCKELFSKGKMYELIEFLLVHHYDPEYIHSIKHIPFKAHFTFKNPATTAFEIERFIKDMITA